MSEDLYRHRFDSMWWGILFLPCSLLPKEAKVYRSFARLLPRIPGPHTLERLCNVP